MASSEEYFWRQRKQDFALLWRLQRLGESAVVREHVAARVAQLQRGELFRDATPDQLEDLCARYEQVSEHSVVRACMRRPIPAVRRHKVRYGDCVVRRREPTGRSGAAEVRVYYDDQGRISHAYWCVQTCRNALMCPHCARKILWRHRGELSAGLSAWKKSHPYGYMVFATYTVPHSAGDVLPVLMARLDTALLLFRAGNVYEQFKAQAGEDGYVRAFEVTYGDGTGWHPHYHEIRLFDSEPIIAHNKAAVCQRFWKFVKFLKFNFDYHDCLGKIIRYIDANYFLIRLRDGLVTDAEIICFLHDRLLVEQFSVDFDFILGFRPYYPGWQLTDVVDLVARLHAEIVGIFDFLTERYIALNSRRNDHVRCARWVVKLRDAVQVCVRSCSENTPRLVYLLDLRKSEIVSQLRVLKRLADVESVHTRRALRAELQQVLMDLRAQRAKIQAFLGARWVECCLRSGLGSEAQRDAMGRYAVRICSGVSTAQWRYLTKSVPFELTNPSRTKECRAAGRVSQWALLRSATDGRLAQATREKYARLWVDYMAGMRGRAVLYWAPGLRAKCGLTAKKGVEGDVLYLFGKEAYERVGARALQIALAHGLTRCQRLPSGFRRLFDSLDLDYVYRGGEPDELEFERVRKIRREAREVELQEQIEAQFLQFEAERRRREEWRKFLRMCAERDVIDAAEERRARREQEEFFRELAAAADAKEEEEEEENMEEFAAAVCDDVCDDEEDE